MSKDIAILKIENKKRRDKIKSKANKDITKLPKFISEIVKKNYNKQNDGYPLFIVIFLCSLGYLLGHFVKHYIF